jgi:hypothetical protein
VTDWSALTLRPNDEEDDELFCIFVVGATPFGPPNSTMPSMLYATITATAMIPQEQ